MPCARIDISWKAMLTTVLALMRSRQNRYIFYPSEKPAARKTNPDTEGTLLACLLLLLLIIIISIHPYLET